MKKKIKSWTQDELLAAAKKYSTLNQWRVKSPKTYIAAFDQGRLFFEKCWDSMKMKNPSIKWSDNALMAKASKYKTRREWQKKSGKTYIAAYRRGKVFFESCCEHMKGYKRKWTDKELLAESSKYKTVGKWKSESQSTYVAALHKGKSFFKKCAAHMPNDREWKSEAKIVSEIEKYCK